MRKFLNAAKRIMRNLPPNEGLACLSNLNNTAELKNLSDWYAGLYLTCPFLRNNKCSIYMQRPFVCREHFVSGSPQSCSQKSGGGKIIEIPVQMGNVLCKLSKELTGVGDCVIMPLAFAWQDVIKQIGRRSWPAEILAALFAKIVKESVGVGLLKNTILTI